MELIKKVHCWQSADVRNTLHLPYKRMHWKFVAHKSWNYLTNKMKGGRKYKFANCRTEERIKVTKHGKRKHVREPVVGVRKASHPCSSTGHRIGKLLIGWGRKRHLLAFYLISDLLLTTIIKAVYLFRIITRGYKTIGTVGKATNFK